MVAIVHTAMKACSFYAHISLTSTARIVISTKPWKTFTGGTGGFGGWLVVGWGRLVGAWWHLRTVIKAKSDSFDRVAIWTVARVELCNVFLPRMTVLLFLTTSCRTSIFFWVNMHIIIRAFAMRILYIVPWCGWTIFGPCATTSVHGLILAGRTIWPISTPSLRSTVVQMWPTFGHSLPSSVWVAHRTAAQPWC